MPTCFIQTVHLASLGSMLCGSQWRSSELFVKFNLSAFNPVELHGYQWPLLLTCINFNPSMDK